MSFQTTDTNPTPVVLPDWLVWINNNKLFVIGGVLYAIFAIPYETKKRRKGNAATHRRMAKRKRKTHYRT